MTHVVRGDGFNPDGGGFAVIIVDGKKFDAQEVGKIMSDVGTNGLNAGDKGEIDAIRSEISELIMRVATLGRHRSYSTAITKLDEARHWLNDRKERGRTD